MNSGAVWRKHAARLLEVLQARDLVRDPRLEQAYWTTPRHHFIDGLYMQDPRTLHWTSRTRPPDYETNEDWLSNLYQDQPIIVRTDDRGIPVSSNSAPSLVFELLELLDVQAGDHVLEIGTGTGQLTLLLSFLATVAGQVTSLEIIPELARAARLRLENLGVPETVSILEVDARIRPLGEGTFDRVTSTASSPAVPGHWLTALKPGGILCMEIRRGLSGAILVGRKPDPSDNDGQLVGSFVERRGAFMPLRDKPDGAAQGLVLPFGFGFKEARRRASEGVGFKQVISRPFDWYCQLDLPDSRIISLSAEVGSEMYLVADECLDAVKLPADGSVPGSELVSYGDTSGLADRLVAAWRGWHAAGRPSRPDYTFRTDGQGRQHVALKDGSASWTLS